MTPQDQFRELAKCAVAKDLPRVLASGRFAVSNGDDPQHVLDCLLRNQPDRFDLNAAKRQRESYQ